MTKLDKFLGYIEDEAFVKALLEKLAKIKVDNMDENELDDLVPVDLDLEEPKDRTLEKWCDMDELRHFVRDVYEDFYEWCFPEELLETGIVVEWENSTGKHHVNICDLYDAEEDDPADCDFTSFFEELSEVVNDTVCDDGGEPNESGLFYGWLMPLVKELLAEKLKINVK